MNVNKMNLNAALFLPLFVCFMTACCDDDKDVVMDNEAGTIELLNLSNNETIEGEAQFGFKDIVSSRGTRISEGDTIQVKFTPKEQYAKYTFVLSCTKLEPLNRKDLFRVTDLTKKDVEPHGDNLTSYIDTIMIQFRATCKGDDYNLSATKDVKVNRMTLIPGVKNTVVDEQAGTFKVMNLSYNDESTAPSITALPLDTLKVLFISKQDYKDIKFIISCEGLNQLNDSMYVVKKSSDRDFVCKATAEYKAETENEVISYTAESDIQVKVPESYVIMPYRLSLSQDLAEMVTPEITYTDAEGKEHTFIVPEEILNQRDSTTIYEYVDLSGVTHFTSQSEAQEGWTIVDQETLANPVIYRFYVRYYKVGIKTEVKVRYISKSDVSLTRERYKLSRKIDRESAQIHIPNRLVFDNYFSVSLDITIGGGEPDGTPKEKIPAAIEELSKIIDELKFGIDENGSIKKIVE